MEFILVGHALAFSWGEKRDLLPYQNEILSLTAYASKWDLAYATWRRRWKKKEQLRAYKKQCKSENGNEKDLKEQTKKIYRNVLRKITK